MIEDKNSLIEGLKWEMNNAKTIIENNSKLFDKCKHYHDLWINEKENRAANLFMGDNFAGVNLDLFLAKNDSMDDVNLFLDEIPYEVTEVREYTDGKWIRYIFNVGSGALHLMFNYGNSVHCKLVETGETKPVYKRVCV